MDIYDTVVLVGVVRNLKTAPTFLLDKFFPGIVESEEEYVAIDVDVGKRRLAPFCSPLVEGSIVESRQIQTNTFRPAYIKDKRAPNLKRPIRRMIGERIGGSMSNAERMQANLTFEMEDQIDMIVRRKVWMAASALQTGTITVTGDGFPTTVINFQRAGALTVTNTGAATWTLANIANNTAMPSEQIDLVAASVLQQSGAAVTDLVFTLTAFNAFISDTRIRDAVYYPRSGDSKIDFGGGAMKGAQYKGHWGAYDLWLYNDWYVDPVSGTEQPMLVSGNVILTSAELQGTQLHGAIEDPDFAYGALAYAPKSWTEKDPAQRLIMMQSAPLVVPERVNAAACISTGSG